MLEKLNDLKPGDILRAEHINTLNAGYRARCATGPNQSGRRGPLDMTGSPPEWQQFLVEVTEALDDDYQYKCKRLHYDDDQTDAEDKWQVSDDEWDMDASAYGSIYAVGERVVVYWDSLRGSHIPVSSTNFNVARVPGEGIEGVLFDTTHVEAGQYAVSSRYCPIYRVVEGAGGQNVLQATGVSRTIYNLTSAPVCNDFYPVCRTIHGEWMVIPVSFWERGAADARIVGGGQGAITAWAVSGTGLPQRNYTDVFDLWGSGAVTGEVVELSRHPRSGRLCFRLASWMRMAKADANIVAGGNGTVSVYLGGADTGDNCTAWFSWCDLNQAEIVAGAELLIQFFPAVERWYIVGRECP